MTFFRSHRLLPALALFLLSLLAALPLRAGDASSPNIVFLGDSNTWLGGDDCSHPQGWTRWFVERMQPAGWRSYARSGATWTHTAATRHDLKENTERISDNNVVFNQVERLIDAWTRGRQPEPQLIVIAAGTNDAWFPQYRPDVFSCDVAQAFEEPDSIFSKRTPDTVRSLAEAVRYDCTLLMRIFPHAQIVLLTPMQSTAIPDLRLFSTAETIAKCGEILSLAVVRQDKESCVSAARERTARCFTVDGTHTNVEGARRNGYYLARRIGALLQW